MAHFFTNFLILDLSDKLERHPSPVTSDNGGVGSAKSIGLDTFLETFRLQVPEKKIDLIGLGGLGKGELLDHLSQSLIDREAFPLLIYPLSEIEEKLRRSGFENGVHEINYELFLNTPGSVSVIIPSGLEMEGIEGLNESFLQKLAHDLHSQPLWLLPRRALEAGEKLFIRFNLLAYHYRFVKNFWFLIYEQGDDEAKTIRPIFCDRLQLESRDLFGRFIQQCRKLSTIPDRNSGEGQQVESIRLLMEQTLPSHKVKFNISPHFFKKQILEIALKNDKKILLVEGYEIRVLKAVEKCMELGMRGLVILGEKQRIISILKEHRMDSLIKAIETTEATGLGTVEVMEPSKYIQKMVPVIYEMMKRKNITLEEAERLAQQELYLAGALLNQDYVHGVVAGAHFSTADTLKAAIRMVGLEEGHKLISSFFLMLLPKDVILFADCAVNPSPGSQELSDITIQTIQSAKTFFPFFTPEHPIQVSMISFSTMGSAQTPEVEKINQTVEIVRERLEQLKIENTIVEGPVQYDTAINFDIAQKKFSDSKIAGKSNVLIFPNLETGNTVYKAVQQSLGRDCSCLGPILQGLKKPYNDLSRGATVDDIVQTILLTSIQTMGRV